MGQLDLNIANVLFISAIILISAGYYYAMGYVLFDVRHGWKSIASILAIVVPLSIVTYLLGRNTSYALLCNTIGVLALCRIGYRLKWANMLKGFAYTTAFISVTLVTTHLIMLPQYSLADMNDPWDITSTKFYIINSFAIITGITELYILHIFKRLFLRRALEMKPVYYLLRPVLLLVAAIANVIITATRIQKHLQGGDLLREMIGSYILIAFLAAMACSYFMQDIRAFKLLYNNRTLARRQEMYDEMLQDAREFRHNISNILYGLEGIIASGNMGEIKNYYSQLVDTCTIINNENIAQLNNLPNHSVRALLLNKMKDAYSYGIPFHIVVDDGLVWRALGNRDMCEVLGALIDNAIAAAMKSQSPMLSLDFGNCGGCMEVIIRNTYSGNERDLRFLRGDVGHGIGLHSAKRIVSKNCNALFNQIKRGRHIETILSF